MDIDEFLNDLMIRLDEKVSDEELKLIAKEFRLCSQSYSITKTGTEIIPYKGTPREYQIYMVSKKIEGRTMSTLEQYRLVLEKFFQTVTKPLNEITSNDVKLYLYKYQEERQITDRTLDGFRLILNGFFKWCFEEGYISKNPCSSIMRIHYESKPREPLTDIEMEQLRKGCTTPRERAIIELFYSTGCRCSELSILKKEDIDLDTRVVKLFGKGKKHRISYLSARAIIAIKEYFESRDDDCEYVIVTMRKPVRKIDVAAIEVIVKKIADNAGLSNVFPHRLRHTFATDALEKGMDITNLQVLLGHESVDTTLIYAKVNTKEIGLNHHKYIG